MTASSTIGTPNRQVPADLPWPVMHACTTALNELQSSPLEPTWVHEGTPVARSMNLGKSSDGTLTYGLWDCTAGKFKYVYGCDEIIHILQGEVTVQDSGGTYTLRPGDVAFFPAGSTANWTVHGYVKKFCIHRSVVHSLLGRVWTKLKKLWAGAARRAA